MIRYRILIASCNALVAFLLLFVSCRENKEQDKHSEEEAIQKTWHSFLAVVESGNKEKFQEVAASKIKCYECLENTPKEQRELEELRENDSLWYDTLNEELIYIPSDSFIKNDLRRLFNPAFLALLKNNKTLYHKRTEDEMEVYEILVTTIEPTDEQEGMQHSFQFQKINDTWKFTEVSSIP